MSEEDKTLNIRGNWDGRVSPAPREDQMKLFANDAIRQGKLRWVGTKLFLDQSLATQNDLAYAGIKDVQLSDETGTTFIINGSGENLANLYRVFGELPLGAEQLLIKQVDRYPNGNAAKRLGQKRIQALKDHCAHR